MSDYIIATNNSGKVAEFKRILAPLGINAISLKEANILSDAEETGQSFSENALIKAIALRSLCSNAVIADDSGLCVDFLEGAPGIFSARFAQDAPEYSNNPDSANRQKLLRLMRNVPSSERGAKFVCSIVCILQNGEILEAQGQTYGTIATEEIGDNGFGYDSIFISEDGKSFGQTPPEQKDAISHRGRALIAFAQKLQHHINLSNPPLH